MSKRKLEDLGSSDTDSENETRRASLTFHLKCSKCDKIFTRIGPKTQHESKCFGKKILKHFFFKKKRKIQINFINIKIVVKTKFIEEHIADGYIDGNILEDNLNQGELDLSISTLNHNISKSNFFSFFFFFFFLTKDNFSINLVFPRLDQIPEGEPRKIEDENCQRIDELLGENPNFPFRTKNDKFLAEWIKDSGISNHFADSLIKFIQKDLECDIQFSNRKQIHKIMDQLPTQVKKNFFESFFFHFN